MKVLICSDSHTRLNYFQEVMELEKPELVIFAGDHSTDALDISLIYEEIPFKIVRGNTDFSDRKTDDEIKFEINGKKIFLTHGHLQRVKSSLNELEIRAKEAEVDICIFGHTHRELEIEKDGILYLNPGALQDKKYIIYDGKIFNQKTLP